MVATESQEGVQACTLFLGWLGGGIVHANGPLVLTDGEQLPLGEADKGNLQRLERRRRRRLADTCQRKARRGSGCLPSTTPERL